ncbi:MAG: polysaccharide biosynthesis protein [Bacteroidales bacterium]|nr:polysaccharide biosynthesis protein [Bacteroidales bacterium]
MGILKKLAGETAIYGLSTILARMINFFFVPIYTRILTVGEYGSYSEIMSYIAVLQVVLVLGLETGCFRFANKVDDPSKPFGTALATVFGVSLLFFAVMWIFSGSIADLMGYGGYGRMIIYTGGILALDSVTAILFARLRFQQKALKFAVFKTIKILSELGFNLLLFFVVPGYLAAHPECVLLDFIPATADFSYIIFAVFLSCVVCTLLFIPDIFKMKVKFDKGLWKQMLVYSIPLMVAGLPGIVNESFDRILFRFFAPEGAVWRADLGEYQAAVKLAVIMNLFIQMFRYAAEPFFFARGKNKELLAKVMEYFTAFCVLIFLGVTLYMDIIGLILGKDFRGALGTVPFMLISYMLLGMLFNVSMWYKLSGETKYAINITLAGLAVTVAVNVAFMPLFSYWASVAAHVLSCLVMLLYSVWLGNRHYYIPYNWHRICRYVTVGVLLFAVSVILQNVPGIENSLVVKLGINTVLILIYMAYVLRVNGGLAKIIGK